MSPYRVKQSNDSFQPVPCGKCPKCRARKASAWSFRLRQQEKVSETAYFLTLTYRNDTIPITNNGFNTLDKKHLQDWFKRLRKAHTGINIKYFAVGEYGSDILRAHYHVIIFNLELSIFLNKADFKASQILDLDGKFPFYPPSWKHGHVTIGKCTNASIGYSMKYISKPSKIPMHNRDDRIPEFALMSKGLGANYLTPAMISWHKADLENRVYLTYENGKKMAMPRYYKDKIYNAIERQQACQAMSADYASQELDKFKKGVEKYGFEGYKQLIRDRIRVARETELKQYRDSRKNKKIEHENQKHS